MTKTCCEKSAQWEEQGPGNQQPASLAIRHPAGIIRCPNEEIQTTEKEQEDIGKMARRDEVLSECVIFGSWKRGTILEGKT